MTTQEVAAQDRAGVIERLVVHGDLAELTNQQRVEYYRVVCDSLGLNPYTKPFDYIRLNQRLVLYATRTATDQLRELRGISLETVSAEREEDMYVVVVRATLEGRTDEDAGVVSIKGLAGDFLANAMMKARTKAKRRVTLSICGLGWMDETELETVPTAARADVDQDTGEVREPTRMRTQPAQAHGGAQAPRSGPATPLAASAVIPEGEHAITAGRDVTELASEPSLSRPAAIRPSEEMLKRWQQLYAEATALGLTVEPIKITDSAEHVNGRGIALREQVEMAKAAVR